MAIIVKEHEDNWVEKQLRQMMGESEAFGRLTLG